ncbi:MFS general substrate transporter [Rhizodiscina lignyota]|uniref:MFS general substrate transporter n=1 Tax=Rhizodiscina lignyota TaxID=1504668 RepID=A0A9P4I7I9_9PEZI|nr:MFS general substrate transporter [Rhizodiscina lignyota]
MQEKPSSEDPSDSDNGILQPNVQDVEKAAPEKVASRTETRNTDAYLVQFDANDPEDPYTWGPGKKVWLAFQLSVLAFVASLASAITAPAQPEIEQYTGVGPTVAVLPVSLYVLGFVFGPCVWGPASEVWGRRWSLIPAMFGLGLFSIGTATSKNFASIAVTRFFSGFFGAGPVANVSAALGDIYRPKFRGIAMSFYGVVVVGGPLLAPTIGSALIQNKHLGWRWTRYLIGILSFADSALTFACMPEIYAPVLLKRKAQRLRKETGNESYWHPHESVKVDIKSIITKHFARPLKMLLTEPIVTCIATYASFVFTVLYMTLQIFPIVYEECRGWGPLVSTTPFLAMLTGVCSALIVNLGNQPRYMRAVDAAGGKPVPEARLLPMSIGGTCFVIGLFVFAGTAPPHVPWPVSVVAAGLIGGGFTTVFQQCLNYLVDTYRLYAASAVSSNTLLRSVFAAGLPLVVRPMINRLGITGSMSLLGGIAALALPVPFVLMRYGLTIRKMSKFAPVAMGQINPSA